LTFLFMLFTESKPNNLDFVEFTNIIKGYMQFLNFPHGYLWLDLSKNGLRSISFNPKKRKGLAKLMTPEKRKVLKQLRRYFCKRKINFKVKIDWQSFPDFTRRVLEETKRIHYGEVCSYDEIAKRMGKKSSARAVGQALARNPIPIVIPCHRVIKKDGSLGGFAWGLKWKKKLLELEGREIVEGKVKQ